MRAFVIVCLFGVLAAGCQQVPNPNRIFQTPAPAQLPPGQSGTAPPGQAQGPIEPPKVALLVPLTGPAAQVGQSLFNAAQLALFEANSDLTLVPKDTRGTVEGAQNAVRAALDEGSDLILGPLFSRAVGVVASAARPRNVPVLTFSSSADVAGNGVFVLGYRPEEQVARVIDYANRQGMTRFAGIGPDEPFGRVALNALNAITQGTARTAFYAANGGNQSQALAEMRAAAPDGLLIADGGPRLESLANLIAFGNEGQPAARLLGMMIWQSNQRLSQIQGLEEAWLAAPLPSAVGSFENRYRSVFGRLPADSPVASLGYDGVRIANVALAQADPLMVLQVERFQGALGPVAFNAQGHAQHALSVLQVSEFGLQTLEEPRLEPSLVRAARR